MSTSLNRDYLTSLLLYGESNSPGVESVGNIIEGQGTKGTTPEGCCNLCFFELPNCIQAPLYDYQGCVVQQADTPTTTGEGMSNVCSNGKISGLTYDFDMTPLFRSTANIAGPSDTNHTNVSAVSSCGFGCTTVVANKELLEIQDDWV